MRIFKACEEYMYIIPPLNPYKKKIKSKQIFQNSSDMAFRLVQTCVHYNTDYSLLTGHVSPDKA